MAFNTKQNKFIHHANVIITDGLMREIFNNYTILYLHNTPLFSLISTAPPLCTLSRVIKIYGRTSIGNIVLPRATAAGSMTHNFQSSIGDRKENIITFPRKLDNSMRCVYEPSEG